MASKDIPLLRETSPVGHIFDFPDFLSPMLVKELRQGLNTPLFIAIFIILQALLVLIILSKILKSGATESHSFSPIIFQTFVAFVCVIQPLRALFSIAAEKSEKKMELVIITKLTPWKLVFGKWCSYMGQSLLISISLTPYLILSYLLGGMRVADECLMYSSLFVGSGLGVAIAILCSNITIIFFRFLVAGFLSFILLFIIGVFGGSLADASLIAGIVGCFVITVGLTFAMLGIGAACIESDIRTRTASYNGYC